MARLSSMPEGTEAKLLDMVAKGMTNPQMGEMLGIKASTIVFWRKKLFIPRTLSPEFIEHRQNSLDKLLSL